MGGWEGAGGWEGGRVGAGGEPKAGYIIHKETDSHSRHGRRRQSLAAA